ncbi:hypothetical protein RRF57_009958 [Xylaria bambusicola]|uniref:Uncharacterized protein n=1 Tax=Xylaria bambusicola TaxID=326684 RepID=A0AAN7V075_9PEZI
MTNYCPYSEEDLKLENGNLSKREGALQPNYMDVFPPHSGGKAAAIPRNGGSAAIVHSPH